MGVDISRIDNDLFQRSSVFGAIHHFDPKGVKDPELKGYALKLRNLDTHIENAKLTSFVAKAEMWTGMLMGDPLETASGGDPIIEIEGRYDSKASKGSDASYVIQAIGTQKLNFKSALLKSIEVNRLELVSKRPNPDLVTGRISLRGSIVLGADVVAFCGVKSVKFNELAVTLSQHDDTTTFGFDAGGVSVDWDSGADSAVKGWLKSFPLRLSGFRWSGMGSLDGKPESCALRWPDIGFSNLNLDLPNLPVMSARDLDFGLEFDLNLGGFGGQTDATKLLRAKFLLGWLDFRRGLPDLGMRLGLGFRFEGGSAPLDVGIQGIFRLRAERVILKTYANGSLIGFGLDKPRLDILGYEIPKDATVQLAIVVEAQKPASQPTWIFVSRKFNAGPLFLEYFAVGQNVKLLDDNVIPSNTKDAVTKSSDWVKESFSSGQLDRLRPPKPQGNKWGVAASGTLKNIVSFEMAFMDTVPMYGLRVEIPDSKPFFSADILYRKISEDLGVYSTEIDPKLPSLEFGVGSLTLPILGFDRLTNGGGGINLGFNGNDFSKAGNFQALPFLGSLGVKMGQYTGLSSAFLLAGATNELIERYGKLDLSPVHEVQLAFRLGFGKEIRQSIFRAGVSLTVYGLFQGALAKVNNPKAPIRQYVKIAGAAGVLLEIFGAVDFALISASVSIRVWVEIGFVVETWQPIELYGEAGVSVYVKFVIARFEVFGKSFELAVHYSFATNVRFGHKLNERLGGYPPTEYQIGASESSAVDRNVVGPIDWEAIELDRGTIWTLPLIPSMDVVCDDAGGPSVVPLLAVHNPVPHGRRMQADGDSVIDLSIGLLRWAVRLHLNQHAADPAEITRDQLEVLQARLRSPQGAPASRWMAMDLSGVATRLLDVSEIKSFLAENYRFVLMEARTAKTQLEKQFPSPAVAGADLQAIVFPWLREVEIHAIPHGGGKKRLLRAFHDAAYEVVTPEWESELKKALKKGRPEYPKDNALLMMEDSPVAPIVSNKSALDLMLEDWVGAVLETIVGDALTLLPESKEEKIPFKRLLAELRSDNDGNTPLALQAVQRASSVMLHGLRVPDIKSVGWASLTSFSELDLLFSNQGGEHALKDAESVALSVAGATKKNWLTGAASLKINRADAASQAGALVSSLKGKTLVLNVALDEHQSNDEDQGMLAIVVGPGSKPVLLTATADTAATLLMPMPQRLQDEVMSVGKALGVAFKRFVPFSDPRSLQPPQGSPLSSAISFAGLFSLRVRKVRAATAFLPGLIEISGAGEQARQILKSWDQDAALAPNAFTFVIPGAQSTPPSLVGRGVQFFTTNLSTEANPDAVSMRSKDGSSPVLVDITDATGLRKFLWMASVVNDAGFFASIDKDAWPAVETQLFSKSAISDASIAWMRKAFDHTGAGVVAPGETFVIAEASTLPEDLGVRVVVPGIADHVSAAPPGFVSLVVSRPYQENDTANPDDGIELLSRYVFLEHAVKVDGQSKLTLDESPAMPPAPPADLDVKASFELQQATELHYYLSVPLGKFTRTSAVPSGTTFSPYMFVGEKLSDYFDFALRDVGGHRFPGKIDRRWSLETVLFRNPLPQLGALPGLALTWLPIAEDKLRAHLAFNPPADFCAGEGLIGAWRDLKFNLDTGFTVLQLEVALRDGAPHPSEEFILITNVHTEIAGMVNTILDCPAARSWDIDFAIPGAKITAAVTELPRELVIRLRLRRSKHVDTSALAVNPAVGETVVSLRPAVATATSAAWRTFAEDMEQSYPDIFVAKMNRSSNAGSGVWLGLAISLDAPFQAEYGLQSYAPRPLSTQFRSGEAIMLNERGENTSDAPRKEAGDVDLDLLMEKSLEMFEDVLSPNVSVKLAAFAPAAFTSIMDSKRSVVKSMKRLLHSIEDKKLAEKGIPEQVKRRFHSLAAKDLRSIYMLGAIAQITRPNAQAGDSTPRIYGSVTEGNAASRVEWSKIRMLLQPDSMGVVSASWKPEVRVASAPFPSILTPSHVEWPWPKSEGEEYEEYVPSRWLELLSARSRKERTIRLPTATVPLPLRRLPPAAHAKILRPSGTRRHERPQKD